MKFSPYTRRFLQSTRGKIILLLREKPRTVAELVEILGLTDNAVRTHLATLERDGLVRQEGERPGARKPHLAYEITAEGEEIFPKAYGSVLNELLEILKERYGSESIEAALRQVGRDVAERQPPVDGLVLQDRLERALKIIQSIGGKAHLEHADGKLFISGTGCPLSAVTGDHVEICGMLEELLADLLGVPVRQCCQRENSPRCRFEVETGGIK